MRVRIDRIVIDAIDEAGNAVSLFGEMRTPVYETMEGELSSATAVTTWRDGAGNLLEKVSSTAFIEPESGKRYFAA